MLVIQLFRSRARARARDACSGCIRAKQPTIDKDTVSHSGRKKQASPKDNSLLIFPWRHLL